MLLTKSPGMPGGPGGPAGPMNPYVISDNGIIIDN